MEGLGSLIGGFAQRRAKVFPALLQSSTWGLISVRPFSTRCSGFRLRLSAHCRRAHKITGKPRQFDSSGNPMAWPAAAEMLTCQRINRSDLSRPLEVWSLQIDCGVEPPQTRPLTGAVSEAAAVMGCSPNRTLKNLV